MAEEDEIDILGDFSFNSCFAQNSQGIPSCSNKEDTIHPQWLLDSTANNWYDAVKKETLNRSKDVETRKLSGDRSIFKNSNTNNSWTQADREIPNIEMSLKSESKGETDEQCVVEQSSESLKEPGAPTPALVADSSKASIDKVLATVTTGSPTITVMRHPFRNKTQNTKSKNYTKDSLTNKINYTIPINQTEILYEDDMTIGSTESVGNDVDTIEIVTKNLMNQKKKQEKKIGNHRRKVIRHTNKGALRNKCSELHSPKRQRKDSSMSEDSVNSPKLQIVLGSGLALPISEGEQVIKIEKQKDSEQESDIEIDVDSDEVDKPAQKQTKPMDEPIAVPLRKFEPMPKRQKRINLDGGGGYTIMHTEAGDLYEISSEPRKERAPRKQTVELIPCRVYNTEKPAPYEVQMWVSCLVSMDAHAHTSRAEVMGLVGGAPAPGLLSLQRYERVRAAAGDTHCDMDPVSQAAAGARLVALGAAACGWHHSHPRFAAAPSRTDLRSQRALQAALRPCLALITSQHWPVGRTASQYKCIRVEEDSTEGELVGYQFRVKLVPDVTVASLPRVLRALAGLLADGDKDDYSVDLRRDVCPQANMTYLDKLISSISHHMRSAGYSDEDSVVTQLLQGVRDVFR